MRKKKNYEFLYWNFKVIGMHLKNSAQWLNKFRTQEQDRSAKKIKYSNETCDKQASGTHAHNKLQRNTQNKKKSNNILSQKWIYPKLDFATSNLFVSETDTSAYPFDKHITRTLVVHTNRGYWYVIAVHRKYNCIST